MVGELLKNQARIPEIPYFYPLNWGFGLLYDVTLSSAKLFSNILWTKLENQWQIYK